jgi:uncharacterized LabA/DUF88 family protein
LRKEFFTRRIVCLRPTTVTCRSDNCPIEVVADFINSQICPAAGCPATPSVLFTHVEQKLVDTMIVADLIYLAHRGDTTIAIVTSDDDMWPGIITAISAGAHVVHVQTGATKPVLPYLQVVNGKYTQLGL